MWTEQTTKGQAYISPVRQGLSPENVDLTIEFSS